MTGELIIKAAIKLNTDIVTAKNHSICISKIKSISQQGFIAWSKITNVQRFVNRTEALEIAIEAGQKINKHNPQNELCSEDLYEDKNYNHII